MIFFLLTFHITVIKGKLACAATPVCSCSGPQTKNLNAHCSHMYHVSSPHCIHFVGATLLTIITTWPPSIFWYPFADATSHILRRVGVGVSTICYTFFAGGAFSVLTKLPLNSQPDETYHFVGKETT